MDRLTTFQRFGLGLLLSLLMLTALGGIVRVTGSGLACPDWPACYGGIIPSGDFGRFAAHQVWLEWTHRLAAAIIGLIVIGYAVYAWRRRRERLWVWLPAALAVPMLGLQVVLGGLTVTERLEALIVTLHLATAMLIVMLIAVSWLGTFAWRPVTAADEAPLGGSAPAQARTFAWMALISALLVYAVIVVGSYVTHVGAGPDAGTHVGPGGAACGNQWPLCYGSLWPAGEYAQWNMGHRLLVLIAALSLISAAMGVVMLRPRSRVLTLLTHAGATLYAAQILFGAMMIWVNFDAWTRSLHLSTGSLIWTMITAAAVGSAYRAGWLRIAPRPAESAPPLAAGLSANSAESESNG